MTDSNTASFTSNTSTEPSGSGSSRSNSFRQTSGGPSTAPVFGSPTSTIRSNPRQSMGTIPLRMPSRTLPNFESLIPKRRLIIRADPTLVSCFDPSDKKLYDLWAPKS
ncbi:hypothetical protein ACEPAI_6318 [Sanghuangporus weigelae]